MVLADGGGGGGIGLFDELDALIDAGTDPVNSWGRAMRELGAALADEAANLRWQI